MARRRYPFYKPVSHRIYDSARRDVSNFFYNAIALLFHFFLLWIGWFAFMVFFFEPHQAPSFVEYVSGTVAIIEPIFQFIGSFFGALFNAVTAP